MASLLWAYGCIALATSCFQPAASKILVELYVEESHLVENIAQSISQIIDKTIIEDQQKRLLNIYTKASQRPIEPFFGAIVERIAELTRDDINVRLGKNTKLPIDHERHNSVLLIDSMDALRILYEDFIKYHVHLTGYVIIYLHAYTKHYRKDLQSIFTLNWDIGLVNANVLVNSGRNRILLYSSQPFKASNCKSHRPTLENQFFDAHWEHTDFYPDKLSNLNGCALICATWEDMPYLELHYGMNKPFAVTLHGIEGKLMEYLAARLNFTIEFYWFSQREIDDTHEDEDKLFDKLFSSGKDFAVGAFRYKPTTLENPYAITTEYYMSSFNFIINARVDILSPFVKLLYPFFIEIWLALLIIFLCAIILLFLLRYAGKNSRRFVIGSTTEAPLYNMFVLSLGGNAPQQPRRNFARYLLLLWLMSTLVLRCSYQALLFHFIRTDTNSHLPKTIAELLEQNYRLFMTEIVYDAIADLKQLRGHAEFLNTSELQAFQMLRQQHEKIAILTAMEYYGYYKQQNRQVNTLFVVPEKVFTQQLGIYTRKNSVLLTRFNRYILDFINGGLKNKWESYYLDLSRLSWRSQVNTEPTSMTFWELLGAFRLLFLGSLAAILVFLGELFAKRCFNESHDKKWKNMYVK